MPRIRVGATCAPPSKAPVTGCPNNNSSIHITIKQNSTKNCKK